MGKAPQAMILPWNSMPFGVVANPLAKVSISSDLAQENESSCLQ